MTKDKPPPPLEWHPWYRARTELWDWLNSSEPTVRIPVLKPLRPDWGSYNVPEVAETRMTVVTLEKSRAVGPAPYVGLPFAYAWNVGKDQYGRMIAGESWLAYLTVIPYEVDGGTWQWVPIWPR